MEDGGEDEMDDGDVDEGDEEVVPEVLLPLSGGPEKACTAGAPGAELVLLLEGVALDWIIDGVPTVVPCTIIITNEPLYP